MKALAAFCAVSIVLGLGASAWAQDDDGMTPAIAQCLKDNAAQVESAEPDLTKATDYLVNETCAAPIALEQRRLNMVRTQQNAERNRAQCNDRVAQTKAQDAANSLRINRVYENCDLQYNNLLAMNRNMPFQNIIGGRPPAAVSMAAKLILAIRAAHNKTRP